jgi:hypothetical protein
MSNLTWLLDTARKHLSMELKWTGDTWLARLDKRPQVSVHGDTPEDVVLRLLICSVAGLLAEAEVAAAKAKEQP